LVTPNYITVKSNPDSDTPHYSGTAEDTDSSDLTDMEKREFYYADVTSDVQCVRLAEAILETYRRDGQTGFITVPMNIGQEAHDYIEATDYRHGSADRLRGNVGTLRRVVGDGNWHMEITFGTTRRGFLGKMPALEAQPAVVEGTPLEVMPPILATEYMVRATVEDLSRAVQEALDTLTRDFNEIISNMQAYYSAIYEELRERLRETRYYIASNSRDLWERVMALEEEMDAVRDVRRTTVDSQGKAVVGSALFPLRLQAPVGTDKFGG